ncbi:MAG: hypothetical protein U0900_21925 [Myxococcota bacterium]
MSAAIDSLEALPGGDLVSKGLADLARSRPTAEAALVEIARSRFAELGFPVAGRTVGIGEDAELALYARLGERHPDQDVYGLYCAWLEQLVSFLSAARPPRSGGG